MQIQIFLDCSASMGKDDPNKAAYALGAAAALGFLAVHNMDKVTFNIMKGEKTSNPFGTIIGKNSYFRAVSQLEEVVFDGEADIEKCVASCPDTSANNGLSVIISDFMTDSDWKKAVDYLRFKHRQVLLVQVLTPDELEPAYDGRVTLIDSESEGVDDTSKNMRIRITRAEQKAYEAALKDFKQDIRTFCAKRDVDYVSVSTDQPIERVLFGELLKVGVIE